MVRTKIKYELIGEERARRETFKKRKKGLFKKLNELKALCEVEACAIITNRDGTQSDVWPSPDVAHQVVEKLRNSPSTSQRNNMVDQVGFLRQNLCRLSKNLDKESRKVKCLDKEVLLLNCLCNEEVIARNRNEVNEMLQLLKGKIAMVDQRISDIDGTGMAEPHDGKGKQPL